MTRIAIIGAGLSGLVLARTLRPHTEVTVFDKSRGVGGRMSTRYNGNFSFDHGAQYFRAKGPTFQNFLQPYLETGVVQQWQPALVSVKPGSNPEPVCDTGQLYVAAPRMTSLAKTLAEGLDVQTAQEIETLTKSANGWLLTTRGEQEFGPFDWVISTAPSLQTSRLFPNAFAGGTELAATRMAGCFALLLGFDEPRHLPWDAAKVTGSPVGWIAINSTKPGRPSGYSLVVQSTNVWADAHLEEPKEKVEAQLIDELVTLTGLDGMEASYRSLHRWRFASTPTPAGRDFLLDADQQLAACGDWCIQGRVEAAFISATALADELLPLIQANPSR